MLERLTLERFLGVGSLPPKSSAYGFSHAKRVPVVRTGASAADARVSRYKPCCTLCEVLGVGILLPGEPMQKVMRDDSSRITSGQRQGRKQRASKSASPTLRPRQSTTRLSTWRRLELKSERAFFKSRDLP